MSSVAKGTNLLAMPSFLQAIESRFFDFSFPVACALQNHVTTGQSNSLSFMVLENQRFESVKMIFFILFSGQIFHV